uniref:Uncharacterized protein n=1 Tax=Acrobeloides nanus TaxID=290746 RepID=A0A914BX17_9BILA
MRKPSAIAQLFGTCRKISSALAPQLTKIDPIMCLQKHEQLSIKVADIVKLQSIVETYLKQDEVNFEPIEFNIMDEDDENVVLKARLFANEITIVDGNRTVLIIDLEGKYVEWEGSVVAKIRHPITRIKIFEIFESGRFDTFSIMGYADEPNKCEIRSVSSCARKLLGCGILFVPQWWTFEKNSKELGQVYLKSLVWSENVMQVEWPEDADNETRFLIVCFGLIQMISKGCPSLAHIIHECRKRRSNGYIFS